MPGSRRSGAAAQLMDFLIGYGVKEIISAGSCGVLEDFPESTFLVPYKALRDEGTSYHYAPPSRFIDIDEKARKAIEKTILEHKMNYLEIITWSTDGFFVRLRKRSLTERKKAVQRWKWNVRRLPPVPGFVMSFGE